MGRKKLLFLVLSVLASIPFIVPSLSAENKDQAFEKALYAAQEKQAQASEAQKQAEGETMEIPEWLKRVSYGLSIETGQKPRVYVETVQPLFQDNDKTNTFFTHDRISIQDERGSYSAGLGYRRLLFNDSLLGGINTFFDFQDLNKHYRQGLGLEAISKIWELRANSYFGLSPRRLVYEDASSKIYEEAVNGGDIELGAPLPYMPWIKVFGSYYRYDFRKFKDMAGWKSRAEFKPFKFITINFETYDDNKGGREYRMDSRLNLSFNTFHPRDILSLLKLTDEMFPQAELKERTLERVERNFVIQVEKWSESKTGGATLEIKRNN